MREGEIREVGIEERAEETRKEVEAQDVLEPQGIEKGDQRIEKEITGGTKSIEVEEFSCDIEQEKDMLIVTKEDESKSGVVEEDNITSLSVTDENTATRRKRMKRSTITVDSSDVEDDAKGGENRIIDRNWSTEDLDTDEILCHNDQEQSTEGRQSRSDFGEVVDKPSTSYNMLVQDTTSGRPQGYFRQSLKEGNIPDDKADCWGERRQENYEAATTTTEITDCRNLYNDVIARRRTESLFPQMIWRGHSLEEEDESVGKLLLLRRHLSGARLRRQGNPVLDMSELEEVQGTSREEEGDDEEETSGESGVVMPDRELGRRGRTGKLELERQLVRELLDLRHLERKTPRCGSGLGCTQLLVLTIC